MIDSAFINALTADILEALRKSMKFATEEQKDQEYVFAALVNATTFITAKAKVDPTFLLERIGSYYDFWYAELHQELDD